MPNLFLLLLISYSVYSWADRYDELTGEDQDFQAVEKEWREHRRDIPALEPHWQRVQIDRLPEGQNLDLDLNSLSVDEQDQVVRYWLRIRSQRGAEQINYEGLHCDDRRYKVYAYAYKGKIKAFSKARWKPVGHDQYGNYHYELWKDIFCAGALPRTRKQIIQASQGRFEIMNPTEEYTDH